MAESSKSGGLGKQLFGAKNEPGRESKRKRKRGKKPVRTQSKETLESELKYQECSTLACDEQNVVDNDEDSKMNLEQESRTVVSNDERETANVSEEVNSQDSEMVTVKAKQGTKINEECMNKDGQQDPATIEEETSEEQGSTPESVKEDQVSSNKKRKLSIRRNKKVKLSKGKSLFNEDNKRDESLTREAAAVDTKTAEENTRETCEKQVDDAAKFEASAGCADNENNDASKSPEGTQEKSLSKSNKGKKLKQLASFGRNKKKPEIAVKLEESSNERHESLVDSPERSERSASTTSQDFLNAEIVDSVLKEPVTTGQSDFREELEHCNDGRDEGTEFVEKEAAKQKKKKGSVLGFKRSKSNLGKRKSLKNEEQDTESSPNEKTSARKESDVSTVERDLVEKKEDEFEEIKLDPKASEMKAADLKTEDISGAAAEMTQEVKETGATAHEGSSQVTPKKEKKENILRRSLRKFKSPSKALQERKKSQNDENSAEVAEDDAKMMDLTEKRESCELEQTTGEQKPAIEEKDEDEEQCLDHEGTSKAVKRKKSDMKNATRAMKRKKEGGESLTDIQEKDELSETEVIEETQDQNTFEESSALKDMENKKELEDLTEVKEKSVDELNFQVHKELSQQKNNLEEHGERRQSNVEEEISRESVTRDDTQTEEQITTEAQEICHKLMKTVIQELIEFIENKEAKKAEENATQVEEKEGSVNFSDEENVVAESQQQTSAIDDAELECEAEDKSYDSDVTVVTVESLPSQESLIEHKSGTNTEDEGESSEIESREEHQTEPNPKGESSGTETSQFTEAREKHETEPTTEHEEISAIIEGETESPEKHETEPNIEGEEIRAFIEEVCSETESSGEHETKPNIEDKEIRAFIEEVSSETEVSRDIDSPLQNESKTYPEDDDIRAITEGVSSQTEVSRLTESQDEHENQQKNDDEEIRATNGGVSSEIETHEPPKEDSKVEALETKVSEDCKAEVNIEYEDIRGMNEKASSETETSETNNEYSNDETLDIKSQEPVSQAEHKTVPPTDGVDIQNTIEAGESSETDTSEASNEESKVEIVDIESEDATPESGAEHDIEPGTDGDEIHNIDEVDKSSEPETSQASREVSKFKGRLVEVKVLCKESEIDDDSDELETKANELCESKDHKLENSGLMESFKTSSCQNSAEEWILVHQLDMTEQVSRQIKHALMFNGLRSTTACCTIM